MLRTPTPEITASQAKWEKAVPLEIKWRTLKPSAVKSQSGSILTVAEDAAIRFAAGAKNDTYTVELPLDEIVLRSLRLEALPDSKLPGNGPGHAGGNFVVTRVSATLSAPQTLQGPYFPTFFDAPSADKEEKHYQVRFSYGGRLDPDLKKANFEVIPKTKFQPGAAPGRSSGR